MALFVSSDIQLAAEHMETQQSQQRHSMKIRQWTKNGDNKEDGKTTQETVSLNKALQLNGLKSKFLNKKWDKQDFHSPMV